MEKYGIENLKLVVAFAVAMVGKFGEAFKDGKVTIWEGIDIFPEVKKIPKLIEKIPQIKEELNDLSEEEAIALNLYIEETLDIANDRVEHIVESGIEWLVMTYNFYGVLVAKQ